MGVAEILRRSPSEAIALIAPDDPRLEGPLYDPPARDRVFTEEDVARAYDRSAFLGHYDRDQKIRENLAVLESFQLISGGALGSGANTPFVLDGQTYPSIRRFYDALKVPPDLRARFAAGATRQELGVGRGRAGSRFIYGDALIEVGSTPHLQLVARAVSAKVAAHEWVRRELDSTGRLRLVMGAQEALGRAMPFALMVERLRRGPRRA